MEFLKENLKEAAVSFLIGILVMVFIMGGILAIVKWIEGSLTNF